MTGTPHAAGMIGPLRGVVKRSRDHRRIGGMCELDADWVAAAPPSARLKILDIHEVGRIIATENASRPSLRLIVSYGRRLRPSRARSRDSLLAYLAQSPGGRLEKGMGV